MVRSLGTPGRGGAEGSKSLQSGRPGGRELAAGFVPCGLSRGCSLLSRARGTAGQPHASPAFSSRGFSFLAALTDAWTRPRIRPHVAGTAGPGSVVFEAPALSQVLRGGDSCSLVVQMYCLDPGRVTAFRGAVPSHLDSNSHPLYTTSLIFKSVCERNKWPASARPASTAGKSLRRTVARFLFFRFTGPLSAFPPGAPGSDTPAPGHAQQRSVDIARVCVWTALALPEFLRVFVRRGCGSPTGDWASPERTPRVKWGPSK